MPETLRTLNDHRLEAGGLWRWATSPTSNRAEGRGASSSPEGPPILTAASAPVVKGSASVSQLDGEFVHRPSSRDWELAAEGEGLGSAGSAPDIWDDATGSKPVGSAVGYKPD